MSCSFFFARQDVMQLRHALVPYLTNEAHVSMTNFFLEPMIQIIALWICTHQCLIILACVKCSYP